MKKRIISLILCIVSVLSVFVSCSGKPAATVPESTVPESTVPESTVPEIPVRTQPLSESLFWLTARGDNGHTSSLAATSDFTKNAVLFDSVYLGDASLSSVTSLDLNGDGKNEIIYQYGGSLIALNTATGKQLWKSAPLGDGYVYGLFDCGKDGATVLVTTFGGALRLLDPKTGRTLSESTVTVAIRSVHVGDVNGDGKEEIVYGDSEHICCISFNESYTHKTLWKKTWNEFKSYQPSIALGDFDGDGVLDIFYCTKGEVAVYDGVNGDKKASEKWTSGGSLGNGRNYGEFFAVDINGDGLCDVVMMNPYLCEHSSVLVSNGEKLSLLWDNFHEFDSNGNEKSLKVMIEGFDDHDGDGRYEIIYSVYNDDGENKWKTYIFHADETDLNAAKNNAQVIDGVIFSGAVDLDGDGKNELILSSADTRSPLSHTVNYVYKYNGSVYESAAASEKASVVFSEYKSYRITHGSHFTARRELLEITYGGKTYFFLKDENGKASAYTLDGGALSKGIQLDIAPIYCADVDLDGNGEYFYIEDGACKVSSVSGTALAQFTVGAPHQKTPVAADLDGDGSLEVIIAGSGHVSAVKVNARGAQLLWTKKGYGSRSNVLNFSAMILKTENGHRAVFAVDDELTGESRIGVFKADGSEEWGYTFKGYHNSTENIDSGIYQYLYGDMNGDGALDIIVFLMTGDDYSESIHVICGKTHERIYVEEGKVGGSSNARGAGPCPNYATAYDTDGDGYCELFVGARDFFTRYEWVDGEIKRTKEKRATSPDYEYYYLEYIPVIVDGKCYLVMSSGWYAFGVCDDMGKIIWKKKYATPGECNGYGATVGNFYGDEKPEIAFQNKEGKIDIYDVLTGELLKSVNTNMTSKSLGSADLNGDGYDDIFCGNYNSGEIGVFNPTKRSAKFVTISNNGFISDPIVADADGDDLLEILFVCSDGRLYIYDSKKAD